MYGEIVAHYARLLESWPQLDDGMSITYVEDSNHDAVVRAFGGDPSDTLRLTADEAIDAALVDRPGSDVVLVGKADGWILVIEPLSGYRGESTPVLQAVADVRAVNVFCSIVGAATFSVAVAGATVYRLDLNAPDRTALPADVATLADALELFDQDWYAPALALAELLTGVRLTDEFLAGEFDCLLLARQW